MTRFTQRLQVARIVSATFGARQDVIKVAGEHRVTVGLVMPERIGAKRVTSQEAYTQSTPTRTVAAL